MIENKGTIKLENEKLILRKFRNDDLEELFVGVLQDRKLQETYMISYRENIEEAKAFLDNLIKNYEQDSFYCWAIEEKLSGKVAGIINIADSNKAFYSCEIGYCIIESFRKRGYATAALKMVIEYLSSLGYHRIIAGHFSENEISGKVMENAGMIKEGIRRDEIFYQGKFHDIVMYIWINEDDKI